MSPYIDRLIMDHEDALKNFGIRIKVNSIAISYVMIILHEKWCFLKLTNV